MLRTGGLEGHSAKAAGRRGFRARGGRRATRPEAEPVQQVRDEFAGPDSMSSDETTSNRGTKMDEQRQRHGGGGRRRRRKHKNDGRSAPVEPILIAARRPNAPIPHRARPVVAPVQPPPVVVAPENGSSDRARPEPVQRRSARIVQLVRNDDDAREKERRRLLDRLMASETRGAISRSAREYVEAGHAFPEEQAVQLQLLEHFDEEQARDAALVLARLIQREAPLKRPILEQRLRRLEEYAEDPATRTVAGDLRRAIRS